MEVPREHGRPEAGDAALREVSAAEVVVSVVSLDDGEARDAFAPWLSPDERQRAARFVFPVHERRFVVARGALRSILAATLGASPAELVFEYGPQGKPFLPEAPELSFNLTHSVDLALVAVTRGRRVGVDIEGPRGIRDPLRLARRFFAPGEIDELARLDGDALLAGFLNGWTRKEAFLKAIGTGLSGGLDSFDVSLTPGAQAAFRRLGPDAAGATWHLHDLPPVNGWFGALVFDGDEATIRLSRWEPTSP